MSPTSPECDEAGRGGFDQNLTTEQFRPISFSVEKTKSPLLQAFPWWS
jgi:hypothetical protein